jgi:hypothetical protein
MIEFRSRNLGHFQVPIVYVWHEELVDGALVLEPEAEPLPTPEPRLTV